jgi:hypothetical protein
MRNNTEIKPEPMFKPSQSRESDNYIGSNGEKSNIAIAK